MQSEITNQHSAAEPQLSESRRKFARSAQTFTDGSTNRHKSTVRNATFPHSFGARHLMTRFKNSESPEDALSLFVLIRVHSWLN